MGAEEDADDEKGALMMVVIGSQSVAFAKCRDFLAAKFLGKKYEKSF